MLGETSAGEFKLLRIRELEKRTLDASDEIQVNVMQKSVVYWKWPNVVDIYCKRADAIKRIN